MFLFLNVLLCKGLRSLCANIDPKLLHSIILVAPSQVANHVLISICWKKVVCVLSELREDVVITNVVVLTKSGLRRHFFTAQLMRCLRHEGRDDRKWIGTTDGFSSRMLDHENERFPYWYVLVHKPRWSATTWRYTQNGGRHFYGMKMEKQLAVALAVLHQSLKFDFDQFWGHDSSQWSSSLISALEYHPPVVSNFFSFERSLRTVISLMNASCNVKAAPRTAEVTCNQTKNFRFQQYRFNHTGVCCWIIMDDPERKLARHVALQNIHIGCPCSIRLWLGFRAFPVC